MMWLIVLAFVVHLVWVAVILTWPRLRKGSYAHMPSGAEIFVHMPPDAEVVLSRQARVSRQMRRAQARWHAWADRRSPDGKHMIGEATYTWGPVRWSVPRHSRRADARQSAWLYED